jgi:hypothetical protein
MADLTSDELRGALDRQTDKWLSGMQKIMQGKDPKTNSGSSSGGSGGSIFGGSSKDLTGFKKAIQNAESALGHLGGKELTQMAGHVTNTSTSVLSFAKELGKGSSLTSKFGIGLAAASAAGAEIAHTLEKSLSVYQQTRDYGQDFNGSILNMHLAAAQARMPLEQFTGALKKYNESVAIVGQKSFGQFSVGLRSSLMDVGQLGLTTDQLNDVVGNYMNTMMMFGKLQTTSTQQATMSMRNLAIESSALAQASGKSRMQLMTDTNQAMNLATLRAVAMNKEGAAGSAFTENMTAATMFMAALPGEAGKTLSTMLAETVGNGSALLTSSMTDFTKAGMYGVGNLMEGMADKIKSGKKIDTSEMANFYKEFLAEGAEAKETLEYQAATGNESAKKMLAMYEDMSAHQGQFTEQALKDAEANQKKQDAVTKAMTNFETVFNFITGAIKEKFFQSIIDFTNSDSFATLSGEMKELGTQVGDLWSKVFTPENIQAASTVVVSLFKILAGVGSAIMSVVNVVLRGFNALADKIGGVVTVLGALGIALAARWLWKKAQKEIADSKARVNAFQGTRDGVSAAIRPLVANSALRVVDIAHGGSAAVESAGGEFDGAHKRRLDRLDKVARGRAAQEMAAGGGGGRLGRFGKKLGGFGRKLAGGGKYAGAVGIASSLGGAALDMAPDFKGKDTLSSALQFGAMGAQVGMMFGPLGAAIGGGIGALTGVIAANWEPIKTALSSAMSWIGGVFNSMFDWFGKFFKFTPLGMVIDLFKLVSDKGISGAWDTIKTNISSVFDTVVGVFSGIADWLGSKFDWLSKFDVMGAIRKALSFVPGIGGVLVKTFDGVVGAVTGGAASSSGGPAVPNVEVDTLKKRVDDLAKQLAQQQKDNQTLHKQLDKLIATVQHGNSTNAAVNGAILDATKKGNDIIGNPLNGM